MSGVKLKVAVCGGGVGGLAFAIAASKYSNIAVEVYEATSGFSSFGAGIGLWPRAWDVLTTLGLGDHLMKIASSPPTTDITHSFTFRKSDQPTGSDFYKMYSKGHIMTFHRGQLQQSFLQYLPPLCLVHYSKRLQSYSRQPSGEIQLVFRDGGHATCDVLVGADGIHSAVRAQLMQDEAQIALRSGRPDAAEEILTAIEPIWTGSIAVQGASALRIPLHPTQYLGRNINIMVYPVSQEDARCTKGPWTAQVDEASWLEEMSFDEWEPEAKGWSKCVERPTKWAIHAVKPLHTYVNDRVVLLGDACHAMDPHQGAGAGLAIEDAYVLAELLSHPRITKSAIHHALEVYDSMRRPFAEEIARRSLENSKWLSLHYDNFDFSGSDDVDIERKLREMGDRIVEKWMWAWSSTVHESLEQGKRELDKFIDNMPDCPRYRCRI
ncbi:uncharacterized protein EV420DRAFT_1646605 [Desarmillaria tabescens]|uniref:FAD-binding domain-containing protein n=1 Tax=Armillaria tabescens TaxID=1929756 RepID=A0AA39JZ01_ARMTA|nr:uncharacterized protein EV420DRAFT_1646605 [Desarmillaria tabescens]KAK0450371.1 hypothetical protein EV420DRAFT_1646605 [Desarmillaria tabescens]